MDIQRDRQNSQTLHLCGAHSGSLQIFSSWKLGLRTSFKNFRRGYKAHSTKDGSLSPPSKCVKVSVADQDKPDISKEEYEEVITELQGNQHLLRCTD